MVLAIVPGYLLRENPHPQIIPSIDDVVPDFEVSINKTNNRYSYNRFLFPNDPVIKQVATRIATSGCDSNKLCQAKAEFFFVRDNFVYVSEYDEYVQDAKEMLKTEGGDCDDHTVLLANLLRAIGVHTRFVHVPRHVYVQAYLPDAPRRYQEDGWVTLDATCKSCDFGEVMWQYRDSEVRYS